MNKIIIRPFIVLFIALYTLCGCASESFGPSVGDPDSDPANPQASLQIKPVVNIPGSEVTRAGGVIAPKAAIAASFFRADENYPSDWTGITAISGGIAANTGAVTFSPLQYYLGDLKTKLVGIYPAIGSGATWDAGTGTVTATIDGATDIMATPIAEGQRGGSSHPALTFKHLLTQVQFDIVAATAQANTQWGKIESITVTGRTTSCDIALPLPGAAIGAVAIPTFSTPGDLLAYKLDGTAATALVAPVNPVGAATFGYCMFEPVTATAPLPLKVKTELGGTVDVTIPTQTYGVGTAYIITLNLTEEKIEPTVTIDAWASGTPISEDL